MYRHPPSRFFLRKRDVCTEASNWKYFSTQLVQENIIYWWWNLQNNCRFLNALNITCEKDKIVRNTYSNLILTHFTKLKGNAFQTKLVNWYVLQEKKATFLNLTVFCNPLSLDVRHLLVKLNDYQLLHSISILTSVISITCWTCILRTLDKSSVCGHWSSLPPLS